VDLGADVDLDNNAVPFGGVSDMGAYEFTPDVDTADTDSSADVDADTDTDADTDSDADSDPDTGGAVDSDSEILDEETGMSSDAGCHCRMSSPRAGGSLLALIFT
jgi:hypothetical protein